MVESGRMTRSAEEWEMSRSCQRATFSKAVWALARTDAGEAGNLFRCDWVALVRHRAGAFLFFGEELFGFADLGALKMADLGGDLVEGAGEDGECGDVGGVAVALDYLRCDFYGAES